jgi:hypothetical protein
MIILEDPALNLPRLKLLSNEKPTSVLPGKRRQKGESRKLSWNGRSPKLRYRRSGSVG